MNLKAPEIQPECSLDTSLHRNEEPRLDDRNSERDSIQTANSSIDSAPFTSLTTVTTHASATTAALSVKLDGMSRSIPRRPVPNVDGQQQDTDEPQVAGLEHQHGTSQSSPTLSSPETTIIELISTSVTASAFPESFGLTVSQKGQWIAAYTSTALYIIRSQTLPAASGRFFKVRRKPLAIAICDYPQSLAVLSNSHNVDVYSCEGSDDESGVWSNLKQRSVIFGHEISTIALSPDGKILAAGYRGGIEIVAVAPGAPENQRRQISCEPMAEVAFSDNGRSLLATSTTRKTRPSTVMSVGSSLDAPISDEGFMESLPPDQAWISQLLFPERAAHARQAAMIPDNMTGQVNDLFAFNAETDSWGVYDLTMKKFTANKVDVLDLLPSTRKMNYETALPAVASDYSQVAIAVKHEARSEILVYQIPFAWRADSPVSASPNSEDPGPLRPAHVIPLLKAEGAAPESIIKLRWLGNSVGSRWLLALASTAVQPMEENPGDVAPAAAGRIVLVDFGSCPRPTSSPRKVFINFDELPEETLGDEHMDFEREVSILRSRTQVVRRWGSNNSTDARRPSRSSTALGLRTNALLSPSDVSEASLTRRHSLSSITSDEAEQNFGALVLDEPYSQAQPRSQFSLQRAATISAQSGASRRHLIALPNRPLEYRRADGLRHHPHESDADNWVPPPPPYSREIDPAVSQPLPNPSGQSVPRRPIPPSVSRASNPADPPILQSASQHGPQPVSEHHLCHPPATSAATGTEPRSVQTPPSVDASPLGPGLGSMPSRQQPRSAAPTSARGSQPSSMPPRLNTDIPSASLSDALTSPLTQTPSTARPSFRMAATAPTTPMNRFSTGMNAPSAGQRVSSVAAGSSFRPPPPSLPQEARRPRSRLHRLIPVASGGDGFLEHGSRVDHTTRHDDAATPIKRKRKSIKCTVM